MKNKLMPFYDKMMLRKRYIIETINDLLKNTAQIEVVGTVGPFHFPSSDYNRIFVFPPILQIWAFVIMTVDMYLAAFSKSLMQTRSFPAPTFHSITKPNL